MSDKSLELPLQAIVRGDLAAVRTWLDRGGNLRDRFDNEETLLHKAAFNGRMPVVRLLLEKGLPLTVTDKSGFMPLHEAARNGQVEVVRYFLGLGADPEARITSGKTSLDLATEKGARDVVEFLKIATQKPVWTRAEEAEISHVTYKQEIGYRLTEIFNFRAETYLLIVRNMEAGVESTVMKTFDELRSSPLVEEAKREFLRKGGALPETGASLDKPKLGLKPASAA